MGLVKQWQMEQAEEERNEEFKSWFENRFGRAPNDSDYARYWDEFELDESFEHAMDSPGNA